MNAGATDKKHKSKKYEIWIKGSSSFRFPVTPPSFQVQTARDVQTVNVNALGEIDLGGKRKLRSISFSSFFPRNTKESYVEYNCPTPEKCIEAIEKLEYGSSCKLIITGTKVKYKCRITAFDWNIEDGSGDVTFSITFQEHRKVKIVAKKTTKLKKKGGSAKKIERSNESAPSSTKYKVKKGDCLISIARKMTGTTDWQSIYKANKSKIGKNPNLIYPGMVLTIPRDKK